MEAYRQRKAARAKQFGPYAERVKRVKDWFWIGLIGFAAFAYGTEGDGPLVLTVLGVPLMVFGVVCVARPEWIVGLVWGAGDR